MITFKLNKQSPVRFCLLAAILLLVAHTASAQITIGGITISKPKRPNKQRTEQPATPQASETRRDTTGATAPAAKESAPEPQDDVRISLFLSDIGKQKREVESYSPADKLYLASRTQENFLLLAVSLRARQEFLTKWSATNGVNKLGPALDGLASAVATKLPIYKPDASLFRFRDPVAEKLLMNSLKNGATIKIHRVGVGSAGWLIQKDNDGLPSYRYKDASVYLRNNGDDHPYCHVISVRVKQDYAGGGTYSTETYRSSADDELFGCP